ncbi:hypothetical protein RQP46_010947 [Phenoliferia psychrophenolica]
MSVASPDFNQILGPFAVSAIADTFFCGVVLVQAQSYFREFTDNRPIFYSVVVLSVIAVFHTISLNYAIYDRAVLHFGDIPYLLGFALGATVATFRLRLVTRFHEYPELALSDRGNCNSPGIRRCGTV